ncbi:MAG: hypothetical protein AAGH92_02285, partial [Planctomycetota bacterium]
MAADSNLIRRCTRRRVELVRRPHPPLPSRDRIAEPVRSLPLRRVPGRSGRNPPNDQPSDPETRDPRESLG